MSEYRYLFADLLTNLILAELPLVGVTFGQELNTAGSLNGGILLSGINASAYNVEAATTPGKIAVYVDRDGTIVWGGVLWSRSYDSASQKLTLGAREFESYFERRRINFDYNLDALDQDQLTVVQNLFNTTQGAPGSSTNVGVVIPTNTSGVLVNKTYNYYDLKPITEAAYELSQSDTGFDWNVNISYDSSYNIVKNLELAYPRRGKVYSASDPHSLQLEFPGNIIELYLF